MAGFFGFFDYTKPGKGVNKDEPEKKGIARFFELFFRKFWNYMKLNILYFITCIPAFLYYLFIVSWLLQDVVLNNGSLDLATGVLIIAAMVSMLIIMFFAGSPFITGYTYILRNYVREEHAWVFSDFFEHTKKNFKQGIAAFFIDLLLMTIILINVRFYLIMSNVNLGFMILGVVFAMLLIIYAIMHSFIWTMMITFQLKLKQIYKNSLLLSILALPRNVGGIIIRLAIFALLFFTVLNPIFSIILCALIFISVNGLISEMFAYPTIKKYMLDKVEQTEEEYIEEKEDFYKDEEDGETQEEDFDYVEPLEQNDVANLFNKKDKNENGDNV